MSDSMVRPLSAGHAAVIHTYDREDDRRQAKQTKKDFEQEIVFHRAPLSSCEGRLAISKES